MQLNKTTAICIASLSFYTDTDSNFVRRPVVSVAPPFELPSNWRHISYNYFKYIQNVKSYTVKVIKSHFSLKAFKFYLCNMKCDLLRQTSHLIYVSQLGWCQTGYIPCKRLQLKPYTSVT